MFARKNVSEKSSRRSERIDGIGAVVIVVGAMILSSFSISSASEAEAPEEAVTSISDAVVVDGNGGFSVGGSAGFTVGGLGK